MFDFSLVRMRINISLYLFPAANKVSLNPIIDFSKVNAANSSGLRKCLKDIQKGVVEYCEKHKLNGGNDVEDNIRTNIFLPNANDGGCTFELHMRESLTYPDRSYSRVELGINLPIGLGSSGHVYAAGGKHITQKPDFGLTEDIKLHLHAKLFWMASFLLRGKYDGKKIPLGVLNVDGLNFELKDIHHDEISNIVKLHIGNIEKELNDMPKQKLFVLKKPIK